MSICGQFFPHPVWGCGYYWLHAFPVNSISVEINLKTSTGTKVLPHQIKNHFLTITVKPMTDFAGFYMVFPLKFLLKTHELSCLVSHHLQRYYEKNIVNLAHSSSSINLKLHRWDEMPTSQFYFLISFQPEQFV